MGRLPLRRLLTLLLTVALLLPVAPGREALAEEFHFEISGIYLTGEVDSQVLLTPGAVPEVDRMVKEIGVTTAYSVVMESDTVTLLDQAGNPVAGLQIHGSYSGNNWTVYVPQGLPAGNTYTLRIKGGSEGIRTVEGSGTMAADHVVSFRTVSRPLRVAKLNAYGNSQASDLRAGDLLARNAKELVIGFDRNLDNFSVSPDKVSVTDSRGRTVWEFKEIYFDQIKLELAANYLPKNETYTLRISGGAAGVRSRSGALLAEDAVLTFATGDQSYRHRVELDPIASQQGVVQTDLYRITAAAGPLDIQAFGWNKLDASLAITLEDPWTPEILLRKIFLQDGVNVATINLPRDGTYVLTVSPSIVGTIILTGQDLLVSPQIPLIDVPAMQPFATQNGRFSLTPVLKNPAETEAVKLLLNDTVLREKALKADGTIDPVVIDPRTLADGVYRFRAMAKADGSANVAINVRTFLVDRESSFTDVPATHWARRYVEVMHHLSILNGRGEGTFSPGTPVTRAEFAKMLALTLGLKPSGQTPPPFVDVADDWSAPHITALAEQGLIKGEVVDGRNTFHPSRTISRAEATTIVGRALGIADKNVTGVPSGFTDFAEVPTWARASVVILSYHKWINGFPDGRFGPAGQLNRDQAAKLLANFIGL